MNVFNAVPLRSLTRYLLQVPISFKIHIQYAIKNYLMQILIGITNNLIYSTYPVRKYLMHIAQIEYWIFITKPQQLSTMFYQKLYIQEVC